MSASREEERERCLYDSCMSLYVFVKGHSIESVQGILTAPEG